MTSAHVDTFVRDNLPPLHAQPEFLFDLPELKFPARLNASSLLDEACARFGDRPALLWQGGRWSYRELLAQVNRIANVLVWDLALQPGNRVLLHAHNGPMAVAIWWAILRAGGVGGRAPHYHRQGTDLARNLRNLACRGVHGRFRLPFTAAFNLFRRGRS